jgi:hypothetical protein
MQIQLKIPHSIILMLTNMLKKDTKVMLLLDNQQ